jgi:hypothetical protein
LDKGRRFGYCNVDLAILSGGAIRVLFEMEESNGSPTQVCGKFLTAALSTCLIHDNRGGSPVTMARPGAFVQVVDTARLKPTSAKIAQWSNLERSIRSLLPLRGISNYRLYYGDLAGFRDLTAGPGADLLHHVVTTLQRGDRE